MAVTGRTARLVHRPNTSPITHITSHDSSGDRALPPRRATADPSHPRQLSRSRPSVAASRTALVFWVDTVSAPSVVWGGGRSRGSAERTCSRVSKLLSSALPHTACTSRHDLHTSYSAGVGVQRSTRVVRGVGLAGDVGAEGLWVLARCEGRAHSAAGAHGWWTIAGEHT